MKKVLFLSATFALMATASFAQSKKLTKETKTATTTQTTPSVSATKATPKMKAAETKESSANKAEYKVEFNSLTIDLGNVPKGIPAEAEFVFKNTGSKPVMLQNVRAACGCTTPTYSKEAIPPGKTGTIKAAYNAATAGSFNKNITITTEAGTETLWIKGNVEDTPETSVPTNNNLMKK